MTWHDITRHGRRSDTNPDPEVPPDFEFDFESEPLCRVQLKKMILAEVSEREGVHEVVVVTAGERGVL